MSGRRELILAALKEHTAEHADTTVEELADLIEATLHTLPTTPFVAVLRLAYQPNADELPNLSELADAIKGAGAVSMLVVSDDCTLETLDDEQLLRAGLLRAEKIHRVPRDGEGLTPCCGKTPFELPRDERVTGDDALVTCRDGNYCTRHAQPRWRCRLEQPLGSCHVGEWP